MLALAGGELRVTDEDPYAVAWAALDEAARLGEPVVLGWVEGKLTIVGPGQVEEWECPHGTTYFGSVDFISGVRSAHQEIQHRESGRPGEWEGVHQTTTGGSDGNR
jgi:hypothetical protein